MVFEGQEKEEFWKHFPHGKEVYASDKRLSEHQSPLNNTTEHAVRLFEVSNATGRTTAVEIPNFTQVGRKRRSERTIEVDRMTFIGDFRADNPELFSSHAKISEWNWKYHYKNTHHERRIE